jgi:hypothetical protein
MQINKGASTPRKPLSDARQNAAVPGSPSAASKPPHLASGRKSTGRQTPGTAAAAAGAAALPPAPPLPPAGHLLTGLSLLMT